MSWLRFYTLETSRANGVTPGDALPFVAHTRPTSKRVTTVDFGGNLVFAGRSERVVRHACEVLGVPRYAEFSGDNTGQSARATLYERTDGWTEVVTVRTNLDEDTPDPGYADYRPPANGDPPPSQSHSAGYLRHPAAVLQRAHDFDTLGGGDCHPDGTSGVDDRLPEPTPPACLDADLPVTAVFQYRTVPDGEPPTDVDAHPWLSKRLPDAFRVAADDCEVPVREVRTEGATVTVSFHAPAMRAPEKFATTLRSAASSAYDHQWSERHGLSLESPLILTAGDSVASALRAAETGREGAATLTYRVAWRLPDEADPEAARSLFDAVLDWDLKVTDVVTRGRTLAVTAEATTGYSPWLVVHLLRDALHGSGHPEDPVAFGGRPVTISTAVESAATLAATLDP